MTWYILNFVCLSLLLFTDFIFIAKFESLYKYHFSVIKKVHEFLSYLNVRTLFLNKSKKSISHLQDYVMMPSSKVNFTIISYETTLLEVKIHFFYHKWVNHIKLQISRETFYASRLSFYVCNNLYMYIKLKNNFLIYNIFLSHNFVFYKNAKIYYILTTKDILFFHFHITILTSYRLNNISLKC